jgi:hypothetical protein
MMKEAGLQGTWESRKALMVGVLHLQSGGKFRYEVRPGLPVLGRLFLLILPTRPKQGFAGTWKLEGDELLMEGFGCPVRMKVERRERETVILPTDPQNPPFRRLPAGLDS